MKMDWIAVRSLGVGLLGLIFAATFITTSVGQAQSTDSVVQITADSAGLASVPVDELPKFGTYWVVTVGGRDGVITAPMPTPIFDTSAPVYQIIEREYLVDLTGGQILPPQKASTATSAEVTAAAQLEENAISNLISEVQSTLAPKAMTMTAMDSGISGPLIPGGDGGVPALNLLSYNINTNLLWLEITNILNGTVYANLYNATDQVYAIWSTTNLALPFALWQVETEVFPSNTNCMPFTIATLGRQNLFLEAQDWTGVDSDGDGIPDWWIFYWFGNLYETAINLDSGGVNTIGYDYTNGYDPNVIYFTVTATNFYLDQPTVPIQINLTGGTPDYYTVLINDTNQADANWQIYSGTNLAVTLGSTDGVYQVWVGLKGFPTNATQTWGTTDIPFNLDRVPAVIVITNLAAYTGSRPYIDPAGYSTKSLNSLNFVVTNANGQVSLGDGEIISQGCNPLDMRHVTNSFQCLDLPLTQGTNYIGIQAVDWAGNLTSCNFSYVFNTNGDTTPPAISLIWPLDGMEVSGNNFTLRGVLDDDTATVYGESVDSNGGTNIVSGLVERGGRFWLENLPLSAGTNEITVTATDAAGNTETTNLTLVQSSVTLTMNTVDDSQLNQAVVNVTGNVSDPSYAVWVNGVQGTNNGDGTWFANNVPVTSGGTASFDITGYPPAFAPTGDSWTNFSVEELAYANPMPADPAQANVSQDKPPLVYVSGINLSGSEHMVYTNDNDHTDTSANSIGWGQGNGGQQTYTANWSEDGGAGGSVKQNVGWPADPGYTPSLPASYQYVSVFTNSGVAQVAQDINANEAYYPASLFEFFQHTVASVVYSDAPGYLVPPTVDSTVQMTVNLFTGGKSTRNTQSLFILNQGLTWVSRAGWDGGAFDTNGPVPSTEITIGGAGTEDTNGNAYTILADGQSIAVTARANRSNYAGGLPSFGKYKLNHQVGCAAVGDTNLDRTTLGIGETVSLGGMPDGTTWSLAGDGRITSTNGGSTTFIAPLHSTSATITATYKAKQLSVGFGVVPPSSITALSYVDMNDGGDDPAGNMMGANTSYTDVIGPTNVSFANVIFRELQVPNGTITWPNGTNSIGINQMATNGFALGICDNSMFDHVSIGLVPTNYLFNGTSSVNFTYPMQWYDQYQDDNSNWVSFFPLTASFQYDGRNKKCQVIYLGMPSDWEGPFDQ